MPPDLNSMPRSPRPPSGPSLRSPGGHGNVRGPASTNAVSTTNIHPMNAPPSGPLVPTTTSEDSTVSGPGPMRHPRPLTAADLHLLLEQEQEGIVNRLTRELSTLRAQSASAASNASSSSSLAISASNEPYGAATHPHHLYTPHQHPYQIPTPTSARRHRSSSSLSARSGRSLTGPAPIATAGATSVSGVAPAREVPPTASSSSRPSVDLTRDQRPSVSRQSSTRSEMRNPHPNSAGFRESHNHSHRPSLTSPHGIGPGTSGQGGLASPTARYEESLAQREELEALKRENEGLRKRIKELEVERRRSISEAANTSQIPRTDDAPAPLTASTAPPAASEVSATST